MIEGMGNAPILPEGMLALLLDLADALHGLDRGLDDLAIVADGDVAALLEVNRRVLGAEGELSLRKGRR